MGYVAQDHFFKKAKRENYAARSVYKLKQINEKFRLIRHADRVLDLGCAPGSWLQYALQTVGNKGTVVGIDLQEISIPPHPNMIFIRCDVKEILDKCGENPELKRFESGQLLFDCVLSDMAPRTTGIRLLDQQRSLELVAQSIRAAERWLKAGGHYAAKVFESDDIGQAHHELTKLFWRVHRIRPKGTRKQSKELYFIGLKKR